MTNAEMRERAITWIEASLKAEMHKERSLAARDAILGELAARDMDGGSLFNVTLDGRTYHVAMTCTTNRFGDERRMQFSELLLMEAG